MKIILYTLLFGGIATFIIAIFAFRREYLNWKYRDKNYGRERQNPNNHIIMIEHGDIVMVEVPEDAYRFSLVTNKELEYRYGNLEYSRRGNGLDSRIPLRSIESYTIVGLSSKLTEDEWRGIVGDGQEDYKTIKWRDFTNNKPLPTATESGLSLLKSKNLSPDTTLILKKNKP